MPISAVTKKLDFHFLVPIALHLYLLFTVGLPFWPDRRQDVKTSIELTLKV